MLQGHRESQVQTWDTSPGFLIAQTACLGFCLFLSLYIPPPSVLYFNECASTTLCVYLGGCKRERVGGIEHPQGREGHTCWSLVGNFTDLL